MQATTNGITTSVTIGANTSQGGTDYFLPGFEDLPTSGTINVLIDQDGQLHLGNAFLAPTTINSGTTAT